MCRTHWHCRFAAQVMHQSGIIAYPTEAVFGLGCDPWNADAVLRLLAIKQRHLDKGLILVGENLQQLLPYIDSKNINIQHIKSQLVNDAVAQGQDQFHRAQTWIVPKAEQVPYWLSGNHAGIAVRISQHPRVRQLCREFNGAIVSTSANISGRGAIRKLWNVRRTFANNIDYYVPGDVGNALQVSEIRDAITNTIVRDGS